MTGDVQYYVVANHELNEAEFVALQNEPDEVRVAAIKGESTRCRFRPNARTTAVYAVSMTAKSICDYIKPTPRGL